MTIQMTRLKAFLIHLCCTGLVLATVLGAMTLVLYPDFYYRVEGGSQILRVIVMVDLVLGPLLTAIVFKPGKPGLKFDITVIALVQLLALGYGVSLVYQERPLYLVSTGSVFRVVVASEVDTGNLQDPSLAVGLFGKPKLVYADAGEQERQDILWEALGGGKDLDQRPEFYQPIKANLDKIRSKAIPLTRDILNESEKKSLDTFLTSEGAKLDDFLYYHLRAKNGFYVLAFDKKDFELRGVLDIDADEI